MICKICGKEFNKRCYCPPYDEICSSICFSKNFWLEIIQEKDKHLIVKGECYCLGNEDSLGPRGCGGRKFRLRNLQTGEIVETTNLWCQGDIPEEFRDQLLDTHEFI